jgi:hypothetical protein
MLSHIRAIATLNTREPFVWAQYLVIPSYLPVDGQYDIIDGSVVARFQVLARPKYNETGFTIISWLGKTNESDFCIYWR